jgi:two-component system sensor histidine kinase RpfC
MRFEVVDTGIGISPEARTRIFESFTQADETIIDRFGGTGLGLAISKQLIEQQGGTIGVESEVGAGSTFWFEVDLGRQAASERPDAALASAAAILVGFPRQAAVEIRPLLAGLGVECVEADDLEAACRIFEEQRESGLRRPVAIVDEQQLPAVVEAAGRLSPEIGSPALILASRSERGLPLGEEHRSRFVSAISHPVSKEELAAALGIAIGGDAEEHTSIRSMAGGGTRALSILVADDNRTNQMVLSKILERGGHLPHVVSDGEEAVDALLNGAFDIVFMDLNMPVLNGIEATKLYRFAALGRKRVPIVALTADATEEARERCLEAGMDDCATKPIDAARLFGIIQALVPEEGAAEGERLPGSDRVVTDITAHPRFRAEARALDAATVAQLEELGGRDFVVDIAREFLLEGDAIVGEIKASVADGDHLLLRDRLHALRSGAANIGALRLYELCLSLRSISAAELARDGAGRVVQLDEEFARVRRRSANTPRQRRESRKQRRLPRGGIAAPNPFLFGGRKKLA